MHFYFIKFGKNILLRSYDICHLDVFQFLVSTDTTLRTIISRLTVSLMLDNDFNLLFQNKFRETILLMAGTSKCVIL